MRITAGISVLCLSASAAAAQSVNIDHQAVGCLVADHFPEMTACFQPSSDGGGGTAALAVLALGAAGAGVYYATQKDPAAVDDDGDGVSENEGDCDDKNKEISPTGGFNFTMDFAFTGNIGCNQMNPRQQVYRLQNLSCSPLTVESLTQVLPPAAADARPRTSTRSCRCSPTWSRPEPRRSSAAAPPPAPPARCAAAPEPATRGRATSPRPIR